MMPRWFTVREPRLLGGEHPCPGGDPRVHRARIDVLLAYGVTTLIDLTEPERENSVQPYRQYLRGRSRGGLAVAYHALPIFDAGVPRKKALAERMSFTRTHELHTTPQALSPAMSSIGGHDRPDFYESTEVLE